jgi:hypothetical protein
MKDLERKRKLEVLLKRNKWRNEEKDRSMLFDECLVALGSDVIVLSEKKSKEIYRAFEEEFKVTFYGRIEWDIYKEHEKIDENTFKKQYRDQEEKHYILWSHGSDPVIEVGMDQIVRSLDDVTAVSPDLWIYKENKQVIEIFHDGIIRVLNKG